jgi:hypothetical protein
MDGIETSKTMEPQVVVRDTSGCRFRTPGSKELATQISDSQAYCRRDWTRKKHPKARYKKFFSLDIHFFVFGYEPMRSKW